MKDNLDTTDIEKARAQVHTFDSYARALANHVLAIAEERQKEGKQTVGERGELGVEVKFSIIPPGVLHHQVESPWRVCHYETGPFGKPFLVCVNITTERKAE
jgi:hypothetical protein